MGKLQEMFDKQKELQERLGYDFATMTAKDRTDYIKEFSLHINQELNELLYELPFFKPWRDYSNMTAAEITTAVHHARVEYIDMIHFVLNVGLGLGFNEELLHGLYMEKNKENHTRQDAGYTHNKTYR